MGGAALSRSPEENTRYVWVNQFRLASDAVQISR